MVDRMVSLNPSKVLVFDKPADFSRRKGPIKKLLEIRNTCGTPLLYKVDILPSPIENEAYIRGYKLSWDLNPRTGLLRPNDRGRVVITLNIDRSGYSETAVEQMHHEKFVKLLDRLPRKSLKATLRLSLIESIYPSLPLLNNNNYHFGMGGSGPSKAFEDFGSDQNHVMDEEACMTQNFASEFSDKIHTKYLKLVVSRLPRGGKKMGKSGKCRSTTNRLSPSSSATDSSSSSTSSQTDCNSVLSDTKGSGNSARQLIKKKDANAKRRHKLRANFGDASSKAAPVDSSKLFKDFNPPDEFEVDDKPVCWETAASGYLKNITAIEGYNLRELKKIINGVNLSSFTTEDLRNCFRKIKQWLIFNVSFLLILLGYIFGSILRTLFWTTDLTHGNPESLQAEGCGGFGGFFGKPNCIHTYPSSTAGTQGENEKTWSWFE